MSDNVIVALIATIPPTIAALAGVVVSLINKKKIREVHDTVNGKLGILLTNSKAAGKQEEREEEVVRQEKEKL